MGISPIETVTMPPKSQEASFIKGNETQRPIHNQISLQQKMEQQIAKESRQTIRKEEVKNSEYRYDAKEKGNNKQDTNSRKKNPREKDSEKKVKPQNLKETTFDMRI